MTTWLTDCPETTTVFLPEGVGWRLLDASVGDSRISVLAESFNPGKPTWHAVSVDRTGSADDQIMVLIDHSESSQFDSALDLLKRQIELPDRLVCLALTGSRFRGQRHRPWTALRGNLHLTAHYRLQLPAHEIQAALTMIPAIVSAESIAMVSENRITPGIKWVNDVLVDGRKVSGVLTATHVSGNLVDRVVFGIGINVAAAPEIEPTPFVPSAGCLIESDPSLAAALPKLFDTVVSLLDQAVADLRSGRHAVLFDRYRSRAAFLGEDVRIWPEGTEDWRNVSPIYKGRVKALHPDLSLRLEGSEAIIRSGRLAFEVSCRLIALREADGSCDQ